MIGPRKVDKPLVLYGYGKLGHLAEEIFKELKIPVSYIIDKGGPCSTFPKNPDQFFAMQESLLAICVAAEPYSQVIAPLRAVGWTDIVPVWDIIEAYPEVGIHNGWFAGDFLAENYTGCGKVMDMLGDNISRQHYMQHLDWRQYRREHPLFCIEQGPSLPSTLADIRQRQQINMFADVPMKSISIHNEGCELKTLDVNMGLFQKHRPHITCTCYHSRDGLWKIPKFCMDNLPDYTWTFRLTAYMGQGVYIYGVPK